MSHVYKIKIDTASGDKVVKWGVSYLDAEEIIKTENLNAVKIESERIWCPNSIGGFVKFLNAHAIKD